MGHYRILGKTRDFITGREIIDTDDERYRQKIARLLVEEKGYSKDDIEVKREVELVCGNERAFAMVDFVVKVGGKSFMVIRYGPGSLVTRERPALASARILETYQIPLTVVTNGEDAEVIDTVSGKVIAMGLQAIPSKNEALEQIEKIEFRKLPPKRMEVEKRFLFAFDALEHSSECDDDFCITPL
ncbi:MAG TPA: hypothetical protein EYP21_00175 [Syntrophaceae bacterium]|nr:hypothetical protein [Syntrophaceae bacterium]